MSYLNDNLCECGHPKHQHVIDNKFVTKWCSLNQQMCDCWQYKPRYIESREYVDLKIINGRREIVIERF
jgi:hypothetical protein